MQNITPCLWFDTQAEDAANFYVSIFRNSRIGNVTRYSKAGPMPEGTALTVSFELDGLSFTGLNGGPAYKFTPAVSFVIQAETQTDIDSYWNQLTAGGREDQCGWLTDKFGVSWQVVPPILGQLLGDKDPEKAKRVMEAMFKMRKLDIATLQAAYDQPA